MQILTVACERDIQDLLLQAHSIDKFIQEPCQHWITVEDESLTPDRWRELLAPYYTKHTLHLTFSKRPDLEFKEPFTLGYRRQQVVKIQTAANVTSERSLVLDCKNIFIRPVDLSSWPYKNSVGRYLYLENEADDFFPRKWINYIHEQTGIPIPKKFPPTLATPFAVTTEYMKKAAEHPLFESLFYNNIDMFPMTEMFYYYFFVPEEELDEPKETICSAMSYYDVPDINDCDDHFRVSIHHCVNTYNSPTHGLHRKVRRYMPLSAKHIYSEWLKSLGLNSTLVEDYVYFMADDAMWGS